MDYYKDIATIVNTKEFRRLQDKTQLFYTQKGDHYRTRLTHTIEVCDIALRIAQKLKIDYPSYAINDSLIIAIAYGHDLGHTPFGHVGERVISNIMNGFDDLGGLIKNVNSQYFKHNIHSYRILSKLGSSSISWQVLDGILKHTKVFDTEKTYIDKYGNQTDDPYLLKLYLCSELSGIKELPEFNKNETGSVEYHKINFALTLEGQIVALADEIAQRASDYDDSFRSGYLQLKSSESKKPSPDFINLKKAPYDDGMFCSIKNELISRVKINDVKCTNYKCTKIYLQECVTLDGSNLDINSGKGINKYLKDINEKIILQTIELRKCDSSSKYIIRQIYKAYYNDVDQLDDDVINRIINEIKQAEPRCLNLKSLEKKQKRIIIKTLQKLSNSCNRIDNRFVVSNCVYTKELEEVDIPERIIKNIDELLHSPDTIIKLSSIIVRQIGYYIAGMTDTYAREEFKKLYGVKLPIKSH